MSMYYKPGDEFPIHSCQVRGTYDGYPHTAIPGVYAVIEATETEAVILKTDCTGPKPPTPFRCSQDGLRAVVEINRERYPIT